MSGLSQPELSVVVCTLGLATPEETVASIAASADQAGAEVEIIVVWQAEREPPALDGRVRVLDVFPVSLSHARNAGLEAARAPVVAFVDDDEVVDGVWVAGVLAAFRSNETAGAVFGPVAPRDDRGLPYCHYEGGEHRVFSGRTTPPWIVGTGGNMVFRREVLRELGGFDLRFGAGSSGHSAEESDLIVRILRSGGTIGWSPDMPVYHPTKNEEEHLDSRYPYGFGMGRLVRRHRAPLLGLRYLRAIFGHIGRALRGRDRRHTREGFATLRGFLSGIVSRPVALSPLAAVAQLPEELSRDVRGRAKALPLRTHPALELRYRLGRSLLLHLFTRPEAVERVSRLAPGSVEQNGVLWVLERRRRLRRQPDVVVYAAPDALEPPGVDAAAATTGATVLVGGVWQTASTLLPQAYALVQSVVAARFLGPNGMGIQSFIAFTALSVTALLSLGFSVALMRYIGETLGRRRPDQLADLVKWAWIVEGFAALVGGGALAAAGIAGANPRAAWLLVAFGAGVGILHTVPTAVLIGAQRWREASMVGLVTGTIATAAIVVVLAAGGGITGMFAVEAVVAAANMIWTTSLARRALRQLSTRPTPSPALRREVGRYALLMSYSALLTFVVWRRSELFFLQHYSSHAEIALYSIAFSAMTALVAVPQAIGSVISPAIATLFGAGAWARIQSGYSRGLRMLLLTSLPVTAGALAVGPATLELVFGRAYRGTGPVLLILLAPLPLIPLFNLARAFLSGLGRLRFQLAVGTVAALLNFGFDQLLIPSHGAVGAAIANSAAQVIAGLPLFVYTSIVVGQLRWEAGALARTAVSSVGTWLAAWTTVQLMGGAPGVILGIAAGTATFALLATLLRVLPADDAAWLESVVGARFGGRLGRTVRLWSSEAAPTRS